MIDKALWHPDPLPAAVAISRDSAVSEERQKKMLPEYSSSHLDGKVTHRPARWRCGLGKAGTA
jgi:hypothetical protein